MKGIVDGALIGCVAIYIFYDVVGLSSGTLFNIYSAAVVVMKLISIARS